MRVNAKSSISGIVLGLALGTALPDLQQAPALPTNVEEFRRADEQTRHDTLLALATRKLVVAPHELTAFLSVGLTDQDSRIRRDACDVIAAKAGALRFGRGPEAAFWAAERPALLPLQDKLLNLFTSDPDEHVRREALLAEGNLEYDGSGSTSTIRISTRLVDVLAKQYVTEQSTYLRAEIVKSLALAETESPARLATLEKALGDPEPSVVQFAVMGIAKTRSASDLPKIVHLLGHESHIVRVAAAQAIASFGAAATKYLPDLQRALTIETDDVARKTIEGTIRVIGRSK